MKIYEIQVNYLSGMEIINVKASQETDAIIAVMKIVKRKEKIRGYRSVLSVEVKN